MGDQRLMRSRKQRPIKFQSVWFVVAMLFAMIPANMLQADSPDLKFKNLTANNITSSSAEFGVEMDINADASFEELSFIYFQCVDVQNEIPPESSTVHAVQDGSPLILAGLAEDLEPETNYCVIPYAAVWFSNGENFEEFYGDAISFMTEAAGPAVPKVVTEGYYSVKSHRAIIGETQGGGDMMEKGIFYAANEGDLEELNEDSLALYNGSPNYGGDYVLDDLESGTTYYYRAFARNEFGIGYGEILSFTTKIAPSITSIEDQVVQAGETIGPLTFTLSNPEFDFDENYDYANIEIEWDAENHDALDIVDWENIQVALTGSTLTMTIEPEEYRTGSATITIWIENENGDEAETSFTVTVTEPEPDVVTIAPLGVYSTTAVIGADYQGPDNVSNMGVLISQNADDLDDEACQTQGPCIEANYEQKILYTDVSDLGNQLYVRQENLSPNTTYYYRAFMKNTNDQYFYGKTLSFTTKHAPTIADIENINALLNEPIVIPLQVDDPDYDPEYYPAYCTEPQSVRFEAHINQNLGVIDENSIVFDNNGGAATVTITPKTGNSGYVEMRISYTRYDECNPVEEDSTDMFYLTWSEPESPSISRIADQVVTVNSQMGPIAFTLSDPEFENDEGYDYSHLHINVSFEHERESVILDENSFVISQMGATRTITITPLRDRTGVVTVSLMFENQIEAKAIMSFKVTVNPEETQEESTPTPPTLSAPSAPVASRVTIVVSDPLHGGAEVNQPITGNIGSNLSLTGQIQTAAGQSLNLSNIQIDSKGNMTLPDVPAGEYKILLYVVAPSGEQLAGRVARLTVDSSGSAKLEAELIDPYGVITNQYTGKPIEGVKVTLHWADTELNRVKGRAPGGLVDLPILPDFAPNQNKDPQYSDNTGAYAWMVFPDADYYILGEKDGYNAFDSRQDQRNEKQGDDSYIRDGNIHVGVSIVKYDFSMEPLTVGSGEHQPYMSGYPDGSFRPDDGITRAEMASILGRLFEANESKATGKSFRDVKPTHWAAGAIAVAAGQQWMIGYTTGDFQPERQITRAEFAQILMNVKRWDMSATLSASFGDIDGHWAETSIKTAAQQGLFAGIIDEVSFEPDRVITRSEVVQILNRLLHRKTYRIWQDTKWTDVSAIRNDYNDIAEASVAHSFNKLDDVSEIWTD